MRGASPVVAVGQVWRAVDPRFMRHVTIESVDAYLRFIGVRTVVKIEGRWRTAPRSRLSYAAPKRFNGKSGGYEFVEDGGNYAAIAS